MRCLPAVALVVLCLCACAPNRESAPQLPEEDQIRETVFRYQFENNASGLGRSASVYFLSVEGAKDPGAKLLMQFDGHDPPVKPASASELEAGTAQVLDRETGLPGLIFYIGKIQWLSDGQVEVEGGYEEASESGSVNLYHLEKHGAHWQVVGSEMLVIK